MEKQINRNWWFLALKGVLFILFGLIAIFYPGTAILTVLIYLGIVVLVTGILFLIGAIYNIRHKRPWELWMLEAIIDIALGLLFIIYPAVTLTFFITLIGVWAILLGWYQLVTYYRLRKEPENKSLYLYTGLFAVIIGILFIFNPFGTGKVITVLIGIFALIFGVMMTIISFKIRKTGRPT